MILLLLPPMTKLTRTHLSASLPVLCNKSPWSPTRTNGVSVVIEGVGLSSEVLVVMGVHALGLVVILVEWAPLCLVVVHEEVCISLHLVDQAHLQAFRAVGKGAIVAILTLVQVLWILGAVPSFVLLGMVYAFNSVVR
jgi:hypothetical protein